MTGAWKVGECWNDKDENAEEIDGKRKWRPIKYRLEI